MLTCWQNNRILIIQGFSKLKPVASFVFAFVVFLSLRSKLGISGNDCEHVDLLCDYDNCDPPLEWTYWQACIRRYEHISESVARCIYYAPANMNFNRQIKFQYSLTRGKMHHLESHIICLQYNQQIVDKLDIDLLHIFAYCLFKVLYCKAIWNATNQLARVATGLPRLAHILDKGVNTHSISSQRNLTYTLFKAFTQHLQRPSKRVGNL